MTSADQNPALINPNNLRSFTCLLLTSSGEMRLPAHVTLCFVFGFLSFPHHGNLNIDFSVFKFLTVCIYAKTQLHKYMLHKEANSLYVCFKFQQYSLHLCILGHWDTFYKKI